MTRLKVLPAREAMSPEALRRANLLGGLLQGDLGTEELKKFALTFIGPGFGEVISSAASSASPERPSRFT